MAGDWIKIEHTTPDKPEVIAIASDLAIDQDAALGKLVRLWIWADQQTLNGNASVTRAALPASFIDRITCARGFAEAAANVGWLVQVDGGFALPRFDRHNSQTAKQRALTYRRVKNTRAQVKRFCNARSVTKALPEQEQEQEEEKEEERELEKEQEQEHPHSPQGARCGSSSQVLAVFAHYRTYHARSFAKPSRGSKEWRLIAARLAEGYSVDDLKAAIDGNHRSPYHCGENERSREYHNLELIVRDGGKVTQFMEVPDRCTVVSEKESRSLRAAQNWLDKDSRDDAQR